MTNVDPETPTITEDQQITVEEWLAIRKEAGTKINPETCEYACWYAQTIDPYGVRPELSAEFDQVGREYFARTPESDIWVSFDDLTKEVRGALWRRIDIDREAAWRSFVSDRADLPDWVLDSPGPI